MAGCGQCADTCNCVIVDQNGQQYPGGGSALSPIVIPRAANTAWLGTSPDGSITITPGDTVPDSGDGHSPQLVANWCEGIQDGPAEAGTLLVQVDADLDCRPTKLRDPNLGEFLGRDPDTGQATWQAGAVISNGAVPFGVAVPDFGDVPPAGFQLLYGQFVAIADQPGNYARIGFTQNGGVDPGDGTFRLPDIRGRNPLGRDDMGGTAAGRVPTALAVGLSGGSNTALIGVTNLPSHSHPGSTLGGSVTASTAITGAGTVNSNGHFHNPGVATRSFVTVEPPLVQRSLDSTATGTGPDDTGVQLGQPLNLAITQQGNNAATSIEQVGISAPVIAAALGASTAITNTLTNQVAAQGGATAMDIMNPYTVCNYIMRIG